MADRHLPAALDFAEGLTALHGIKAVPESLQAKRRADKPFYKSGAKRFSESAVAQQQPPKELFAECGADYHSHTS